MKQILIILGLFASVTTFAQSPRIKLNQITKDTVKGSVLISSPSDSGMVYSRDFYIAYGLTDTVLILYGDTLAATSGTISSVLSDGVTITGNGTSGNELKVDTSLIATIKALNDSLATISASTTPDGVTITGDGSVGNPLKVDTLLISTVKGLNDTLTAKGYLAVSQLTDTLNANTRGFLTAEVDGSVSNEGSLTVGAGTASTSVISSNTSGSTDVTLTAGSNITLSETGNNITIAATGGGASYNNISETADTVYIDKYLNVDTSTLYVDATTNRVGIGTIPNSEAGQNVNWRYTFDALTPSSANVVQGSRIYGENNYYIRHDIKNTITGSTNLGGAGISLITDGTQADFTSFSVNSTDATRAGRTMLATSSSNSAGILFRTTGNHDIEFTAYSDGSTTPDMVISGNNVGIGTSSPSQKLSISGTSASNAGIYGSMTNLQSQGFAGLFVEADKGGAPDYAYATFQVLGSDVESIGYTGLNNASRFRTGPGINKLIMATGASKPIIFQTNDTDRMTIEGDGRIFMPDVYSDLISGTTRDLYIKNDGQLGYISSTAKSKTNIYDLNNVDFIYNLNPVSFNYRKQNDKGEFTDEFYDKTSYGLIAEEVVNVADYMVYYDELEDGGFIPVGVNYSELITPMLKAIQQQKDEIDQLKTLITDLTNIIQILENK